MNTPTIVSLLAYFLLMMAIGRAVEDGAAGQEMRIMNLKSRTIVIAKAVGPDTVTISQSGLIGIN